MFVDDESPLKYYIMDSNIEEYFNNFPQYENKKKNEEKNKILNLNKKIKPLIMKFNPICKILQEYDLKPNNLKNINLEIDKKIIISDKEVSLIYTDSENNEKKDEKGLIIFEKKKRYYQQSKIYTFR